MKMSFILGTSSRYALMRMPLSMSSVRRADDLSRERTSVFRTKSSVYSISTLSSPKRWRMSSVPPVMTSRALSSSAISSQSSSTDSMLWVDRITVAPSSFNRRISFRIRSALTGSKPENGSSRIIRDGLWTTVVMNWTFWAMPLDSSSTFLFHQSWMPKRTNHCLSSYAACREDIPRSWARYIAWSPTFILRYRPRSSGR